MDCLLLIALFLTPVMEQFTLDASVDPSHVQLTLLTKSFTQERP